LDQTYEKLNKKYDYPKNPIYSSNSKTQKNRILSSVEQHFTVNGIPSTEHQRAQFQKTRISAEHAYWSDGINKIIKGYDDNKFESQLIRFFNELDLANISDDEKRLILSDGL